MEKRKEKWNSKEIEKPSFGSKKWNACLPLLHAFLLSGGWMGFYDIRRGS